MGLNTKKIAVLGGGSFGTVIANIIAEKGYDVAQWMRSKERVEEINTSHSNSRYLPDYALAQSLKASNDLGEVLLGADIVFVSIPSSSFRAVVQQAKPFLKENVSIVSTTKGIESETFNLMSQVLSEELPQVQVGVISGPNLAKELAKKQLTATVVASKNEPLRKEVQALLHQVYFRIYASDDIYGVELGGTLKNIYAIASGLGVALGMGENTKSMLLTRSLAEMSRFAVSMGANPMTFLGLAGVGDLIVTCMSPLSRNYRVGFALGSGKTLEQAVSILGEVAEGVNTLRIVRNKTKELDIYMPVLDGLYEVVYNNASVDEVAKRMMLSTQSSDVEFVLPRE